MRIYDYRCAAAGCGIIYEIYLKSGERAVCKKCGSIENQEQVISPPRVAFATSENQPKSQQDLANYLGSGKYFPGYKPSFVK